MPIYRGSWYSQNPPFGWFDPGDRPNSNALGVPDARQGIALPFKSTLGQYFNVTPPGSQQTYRVQQTDIGPAPSTGRGVDISAAAAQQMGYTPKTFPTDAAFKVEPADGGDMPANAQLASGTTGSQKMPSLMDMLNPQQADQSFNDRIGGMSNSLVGLGMGMLQPTLPGQGQSAWGNALQGYMAGAASDAKNQQARQLLALQTYDRAFRTQEAARAQANADRSFGLQQAQFDQSNWRPGVYKDPNTEQEYPYQQHLSTGKILWPMGAPPAMPGAPSAPGGTPDAFANVPNPLAPGAAAQPGAPGGAGAVGYGQAAMGAGGFGTGGATTAPSAPLAPTGATIPGAGADNPYAAPPGMLPSQGREYRKETATAAAKATVANEQEAVKSAEAALSYQSDLNEMAAAYEAAAKAGAIGPNVAGGLAREFQARNPMGIGGKQEALRQRYEIALRNVQARITAGQNKGQGQVSNFERQLYAQQFPQLTAKDPMTQLPFLRQMQADAEQAIAAGRRTKLGASSPMLRERPAVPQPQAQPLARPAAGGGRVPPAPAISALQADPSRRAEFDAYYGPGAADRYLGAR